MGNVGVPASDRALCREHDEWVVVECSSYQLELPLALDVRAAVLTNLAPDHLDRYEHVTAYYTTKWSMFEQLAPGGGAVLPYDLAAVDALPGAPRSQGAACPMR